MDLQSQLPGWTSARRDKKDPDLKIAWRYQNLPRVDKEMENTQGTAGEMAFCERFDLSTRIPREALERAKIDLIDGDKIAEMSQGDRYRGDMYKCVLDEIARIIDDGGFSSLQQPPAGHERNILRLELRSLGSAFWRGDTSILQFLHALRGLLRYSYVACVISLPVHLYDGDSGRLPVVRRIEHLCDAVIELESFEGAYAKPTDIVGGRKAGAATEYHGFLHIHKLPRVNSLTAAGGRLSILHSGGGSANNLAFRQRRKKFCIETYHLPIEGGVTERRVPEDNKKPRAVGCGSRPGKPDPLEF
ncbi:PAXNEB-domain-containing protein [Linderina pennispora]|uniref:Elongator complex protein 4 n=1 Tax=Linderina pennispora TaxID=61395 RepID=A0A1Y1W1T1_9FUNG|nr:PAXNEB-domain-containing protein [Linderina pennispora]ORX67481.1 PAXNEB-domain-containing protein [Linderina pennispora]